MSPDTVSPVPNKPALVNGYRAAAGLLALLVLVQAALAGRIVYEGELETLHGILGNVSFLLGVAALVLAIVTRAPRTLVVVAVVVVVLLTVQIGLGYSAEETQSAGEWHIPNGVAIFGLALYQVTLVRRLATVERV